MGKTSAEVKRRYNDKHYKRFSADIKFELYDRIAEYLEQENISRAEFLSRAINTLETEK